MTPKKPIPSQVLVDICFAKPNKMFSPEVNALIRFLHYSVPVPCRECGKKRRRHWTMMCSFRAHSALQFSIKKSATIHDPLTPVCTDHFLDWRPFDDQSDSPAPTDPSDSSHESAPPCQP